LAKADLSTFIPSARRPRILVVGLAVVFALQLGMSCGTLAGIRIDYPRADQIFVEGAVSISIRLGVEHAESSLEFEVDGVPLVAGLGLVPPFMGESGSLRVGDETITVGDFSVFTRHGARHIQAELSGFSPASHELRASGVNPETGLVGVKTSRFSVVDSLTLDASHVPAAGSPHGPVASEREGILANGALGQAIAAPPLATLGGQSIRSGHVELAEALLAGGS
jgi:hypothetical protein